MMAWTRFAVLIALLAPAERAISYPLDGYPDTGIVRLEAYRLAQNGSIRGRLLPPGGRLPSASIRLRLADLRDFEIPAPDAALSTKLQSMLAENASDYGVVLLDLTNPLQPRYAAHNAQTIQNPASVGKLMVLLAWFQALADLYPEDTAARHALLRDTRVTANAFIRTDGHTVPFWKPGDPAIENRPIREGDEANLWTWLDWMASSSSNAAASTIMSQLVLLAHFAADYPPSPETAEQFFRDTPKSELSRIFLDAIQTPLTRNGLDLSKLRQGSFFTREGKARVPGTTSVATPLELLRLLVKMERGVLVDAYSSLEIKRLIYLSERRIRYASSPELRRAAVYFKSGSLYSCQPEPGFECGKYRGNVRNFMNSATLVETEETGRSLHYISVVLSNVLRKNSATIHRDLATEIHQLMERDHPIALATTPPVDEIDFDEETGEDPFRDYEGEMFFTPDIDIEIDLGDVEFHDPAESPEGETRE